MRIKRVLVKTLVGLLNFFAKIGRFAQRGGRPVYGGWQLFSRGIFKIGVFPVYRLIYLIKYKALNLYAPAKSKVFYILNKGYTVHVIVFMLVFVVFVNNLNAQDIRQEDYGEKTIIYSLITKEVYDEPMVEVQVANSQDKFLNYLDKTTVVGSQMAGTEQDTATADALMTELSTVTQGGVAMVKPNIIQPILPGQIPDSQLPDKRGGTVFHKVVSGETFSSIAQKYNIDVNTLLWGNNLSATTVLRPGMSLEILPVIGVAHAVARGESVSTIAKKYNIPVDQILEANNLLDTADIKIGQKLIIPGGKKIGPAKTTKAYTVKPTTSSITSLFKPQATIKSNTSGMLWPSSVRYISQYFTMRHRGLDIAGAPGIPIYAADDGVVVSAGWASGYGNAILLDHGNGVKTRYGHASKLLVSRGDTVVKGQTIMLEGSTGWSTGPHLHFEVIVNGVKKNPLAYIK